MYFKSFFEENQHLTFLLSHTIKNKVDYYLFSSLHPNDDLRIHTWLKICEIFKQAMTKAAGYLRPIKHLSYI